MPSPSSRKYWHYAFAHARKKTSYLYLPKFIPSILSTAFQYYQQWRVGIRRGREAVIIVITFIFAYLGTCAVSFFWNLLCAPHRLAQEALEREEKLKTDLELCRKEIESFKSEKPPCSQGELEIVTSKFWMLQEGDKMVLSHFAHGAKSTDTELRQIFNGMPVQYFLWLAQKTELFGLYTDGLWAANPRHMTALKWYFREHPQPHREPGNGLSYGAFPIE
jgi:hypothetical protein